MPIQTYALEPNGPLRLEISWAPNWTQFTVKLDGVEVGRVENKKALTAGQDFPLPDGSTLHVQLFTGLAAELAVLRNGQHLPGTAAHPETRLKNAFSLILLVGGFNFLTGLLALLFRWQVLVSMGIGMYQLGYGALLLALAYLTRRLSWWALLAAVVLLGLDAVLGLFIGPGQGSMMNFYSSIVRLMITFFVAQALPAVKQLQNRQSV